MTMRKLYKIINLIDYLNLFQTILLGKLVQYELV